MARTHEADRSVTCPSCGHGFDPDHVAGVTQSVQPAIVAPQMSRADQLKDLRAALKAVFPKCDVTTNDDANFGTPLAVTVHFPNGAVKAARAGSIQVDLEQFKKSAIHQIQSWHNRVFGGSVQPQD